MRRRLSSMVFLVLAGMLVTLSVARAAGDWEWTAGQGWIMGAGVSRPTAKEQLQYAYDLEQRGEFMDSARQYFLLVQNFPESQEAGVGLQRLARCLFEMENYYVSYQAIEQVIKTYPSTGKMSDLVEIELRIAKRLMLSQTPDLFTERDGSSRDFNIRRALEIVNSVIDHDPYGPVAAEAYLVKGEGHLFLNEINAARSAFEHVTDEFPRSDFVERARLGVLRCDSLVGQASPRELADQFELFREEEQRRAESRRDYVDEFDDADEYLRLTLETEAAKMMEQAEQYRRMGTRAAVKSSEFLYKEIVRRYPNTPQAELALERMGSIKVPKEPGRIAQSIRNINLNPFNWNKDPEPPWIVPQLDPDDMVLVDSGLGPIIGVPETGTPPATAFSAGVRPAALPDGSVSFDADGMASSSGMSPAPAFFDAAGPDRVYSSDPGFSPASTGMAPPPEFTDLEPVRGSSFLANNPLPTISESDLVPMDGSPAFAAVSNQPGSQYQGIYDGSGAGQNASYNYPVYPAQPAPLPDISPSYIMPQDPPSLGNSLDYTASLSELVGPARLPDNQQQPSGLYAPYDAAGYAPSTPSGSYYDAQLGQSYPVYQETPYPATDTYHYQPAPAHGTQGGWTMGEDFR